MRLVAFAHVSNVLGSILDAKRAADIAHKVGAKLLLDGCQAAPRIPVDVAAIGADFYVFSAHKIYGPTGIGALWARKEILDAMPPWHGGGAMIDRVTFEKTTYLPAPSRFEAGTPHIVGAIGFHAAIDWTRGIGLDALHAHESALVSECRAALRAVPGITLFGPEDSAGIVSFALDGVHPHDIGTIFDDAGVAVRAGHHCAQPLMDYLGVPATARASFAAHSDASDIEALVRGPVQSEADFRMTMGEEKKIEVEEVDGVDTPPRARVTPETPAETFERKRDYLAGFLAEKKPEPEQGGAGRRVAGSGDRGAEVDLRPGNPGRHLRAWPDLRRCDQRGWRRGRHHDADHAALSGRGIHARRGRASGPFRPGIRDAEVKLVWDPPWDPSKMSDEARLELGML